MKDVADEDRQEREQWDAEVGAGERHGEQQDHVLACADEADALPHALEDRVGGLRKIVAHGDEQQRNDDRHEADAVQPETPGRAEPAQRRAAEQWADQAGEVELNRVHGDGLRQLLARHQGRNQGLVRGRAEGLRDAGHKRQR